MRLRIPLTSLLLASLCAFAPAGHAAPPIPDLDISSTEAVAEEKAPEGDAADVGAWQSFNDSANKTFGKVNGFLAGFIFYDLFHTEDSAELTGVDFGTDPAAAVASMVAALEANGELDPLESNLTLKLPPGIMDKAGISALTTELKETYGQGSRGFAITVPEKDDEVVTTVTLAAYSPGVAFAVLWLVLGAIFFTVRMGFINIRGFKHALAITRGKYDNPDDEGEVSHFQALTSALSATVGLGNIAGVAIAISIGGPGATFWMICAGFLGMTSKFVECSLAQMYRVRRPDGRMMGGPMVYLSEGLKDVSSSLAGPGKVLAYFFAILCIGGSLAGGNAFQVNQSMGLMTKQFDFLTGNEWAYGLLMTVLVGIVIIGGIKRIAATAEKVVPLMCGIYVAACIFILVKMAGEIPGAFGTIFSGAFTPAAGFGGLVGVLVQGFKRAAFSNEAGTGSAAIAHSAAKTDYPIREGAVAMLGPFIDTVIICTMTALVIVITGAYDAQGGTDAAMQGAIATKEGAVLTSLAMGGVIPWFPKLLALAVFFFAYSTIISWSYYGERCWVWMFGDASSLAYKILFLVFVFLGSVVSAVNVLEFGDLMILGMALPNILGVVLLTGKVRVKLDEYWKSYEAGEFKTYD
ncbi:MAG: alanine/glycine:cation symporter family protein [Planctomycetota bacterium]|nr:alanine/glycine:cation symporter family protein [Planctomycetota bacterium]MDG2144173.1 alanine/glycine:cation symporter family protein [Planctomycetota bacterium]